MDQKQTLAQEIIEILQQDARTSPRTISAMLSIPIAEVEKEIQRLEDEDIILKYGAVINEEKTEDDTIVHALIEVKVMPQYKLGYESIAQSICVHPEVRSCFLMSGGYDYMVLIDGRSVRQIAQFVAEKLAVLDGVTSTATHFVLRKYKDNHVIMPVENTDKRQVVTP